jgi:VWFA-related protein
MLYRGQSRNETARARQNEFFYDAICGNSILGWIGMRLTKKLVFIIWSVGIVAGGIFISRGDANDLRIRGSQTSTPPQPPQQPAATQTPAPLRSTTRLVQVSVVVHDKSGEPMRGLTKDDFVVLDDKKPQPIQIFSVETNEAPANPPSPLPPDTYTNQFRERSSVPTSITVILLDGLNTEYIDQTTARKQVVKFLQQIHPQDRVAIYSLGQELTVLHDFTSDATSLLAALARYNGKTTGSLDASTPEVADTGSTTTDEFLNNVYQRESNFFVRDRMIKTLAALTEIANHVGTLPGRKNLIWVSGSFPFSIGFENKPTGNDPGVTDLPGSTEFFGDEINAATRVVTNANLVIYPVDARGLIAPDLGNSGNSPNAFGGSAAARSRARGQRNNSPFPGPDPENFVTMNDMAERTGGKAFYNTNDIFKSLQSAVDDSRVTYELGFYPEGVDWNGSFHTIKVEVKRPGAKVRSRLGYFALPEPKLTNEVRQTLIAETAVSPIDATQIGVGVVVRGFSLDASRKISLTIGFDPREFNFQQSNGHWADNVDTVYVQLDDKGHIAKALDETLHLDFDAPKYEILVKSGVRFAKEIQIVPNAVELRVILRDASTGNIGDTTVPLAKYFPVSPSTVN